MDKQSRIYQAYVQILKEELIPAMGCTEPIAIAYAAAKARDVLGGMPDKVEIGVSSNIIKNVKSVIVPNTDGMKGIEAAAAAGIVGGQADKALEVISAVTADQKAAMRAFLKQVPVTVKAIDNGFIFDIIVTLQQGSDSAVVRICQYHTNIVLIQRNSEVLLDHTAQETKQLCRERSDRPGTAEHCGYLCICRYLRDQRHPIFAGNPDPVQHPHLGGGTARGLRCEHRFYNAEILRRGCAQLRYCQGSSRL